MSPMQPAADFLRRLLNPDDLGWSVTPEVRAGARQVLRVIQADAKRLYVAGPMSGLPEYNYPAFKAAAAELRECGFEVICPAENGLPADAPWIDHMRVDIGHLLTCSAVAVLPGWENSRGARLEVHLARELGLTVQPVQAWVQAAREEFAAEIEAEAGNEDAFDPQQRRQAG